MDLDCFKKAATRNRSKRPAGALNLMSDYLGPDHLLLADVLMNLGKVQLAVGDRGEAKKCFEKALAIREKTPGRDQQEVASILSNLANVSFRSGELADASVTASRLWNFS